MSQPTSTSTPTTAGRRARARNNPSRAKATSVEVPLVVPDYVKAEGPTANIVLLDKKTMISKGDDASTTEMLQPHPDHILELRTINGSTFKGIMESLKNVLNDANLVFTEKGLRMTMIDSHGLCASFLSMDSSYFELYHCTLKKLILGVDIHWLYKVIKPLRMQDILMFVVHKDEQNVLRIIMENTEKATRAVHKVKLKLLEEEQYEINDKFQFEFDFPPPEIDSNYFQSICRNLHAINAKEVEITYTGDRLRFRGIEGETDSEFAIAVDSGFGDEYNFEEGREIKGSFLLDYLHNFTKAAHHLSKTVRIALQPDNYLLIEYEMKDTNISNTHNSLRYLLCQYDKEQHGHY